MLIRCPCAMHTGWSLLWRTTISKFKFVQDLLGKG